jgi:hypothetical protein
LLPNGGPAWQPALVMLLLGGALGLFQLPLIVGVQSTVRWAERGTATSSILFCRQVGQSVGAAVFGAVANAALSGTPGGVAGLRGLNGASEAVRRAVGAAVNHVYAGAVLAAGVAVLVLVFVMPRRFPVLAEGDEG